MSDSSAVSYENIEALLRPLIRGEHSSLIISFNEESARNYQSVAEFIEQETGRFAPENDEWVSEEERLAAIEKNSWWSAQWYPDTPVGFFRVSASSLVAILKYLETFTE